MSAFACSFIKKYIQNEYTELIIICRFNLILIVDIVFLFKAFDIF